MIVWREIYWQRPVEASHALGFLTTIAADAARGPLVLEVRAEAGAVRYLLGGDALDVSSTASVLRRLVPGTTLTELAVPRQPVERAGRFAIRQRSAALALEVGDETLRALLAALAGATGKADTLVLQLVLGSGLAPELLSPRVSDPGVGPFELLVNGATPVTGALRARLQAKLGQYRFRAVLRLGISSPSPVRRRLLVHGALAALRTMQTGGTRVSLRSIDAEQVDEGYVPLRQPLRLTAEEALPLLAWPIGEGQLPGLPAPHPHRIPTPPSFRSPDDRLFGITTAAGKTLGVGIAMADALRHTHVYGPTGVGKSTLLLRLIAADIAAGRSVVVIDPKRDLATDSLSLIPKSRVHNVAIIDPALEQSAGVNPFAGLQNGAGDEQRPLVADAMLDLFRSLYPSAFGPLTADTLHASLLTLTYAPDASLARLPDLLTNPKYLQSVLTRVSDPVLLGFWEQYRAKSPGQQTSAIGPVLTRLRALLLRPGVRTVLDQPNPRFSLDSLFDRAGVLVVSLNKGVLGTQTASLLGSIVVAQLWHRILRQALLPADKRRPVSIYIDEAQHFLHLGDLAEALEQSRSLGAAWHLAHQHRAQMPDKLLHAIDANCRNKIIFGLEDDEARTAARITGLDARDFTQLPPHEIYASLQNGGTRTGWFSARVLPPPQAISSTGTVIAESIARFGGGAAAEPVATVAGAPAVHDDEPIGRTKRSRT